MFCRRLIISLLQTDQRKEIARLTYQISVFTEGILAMEETLLGVIQVNPKQILHDGIRSYVVEQLARTFHNIFNFEPKAVRRNDVKQHLEERLQRANQLLSGFRKSFEYVQDYIDIYGLKVWQEELTRVMGFFTEQECNRFVKEKILPFESVYQSEEVPITPYMSVSTK